MTGTQGLIAFIAGPVIGVFAATLLRQTRVGPVLLAALLGEIVAVMTLQLWSRWLLHRSGQATQDRLVAVAADVSLANRLSALGVLALLSLAIGGLALLFLRIAGRRAS